MNQSFKFSKKRITNRSRGYADILNILQSNLNVTFDSEKEKPIIHKIKVNNKIVGIGKIILKPSRDRLSKLGVPYPNDYKIGLLKGLFVEEGFRKSDGIMYNKEKSIGQKLIDMRIQDARTRGYDCLLTTAREGSSKMYREINECFEVGKILTENGERSLFIWVNMDKHDSRVIGKIFS